MIALGPRRSIPPVPDAGHLLEAHLVAAFVSALRSSRPEIRVVTEWHIGSRIADIVWFPTPDVPRDSRVTVLRRSSMTELRVLAEVVRRPRAEPTLARRLYAEPRALRECVRNLESKQLVVRGSGGALCAGWLLAHLPQNVTVVEAKLRDWRQAIRQASYYLDYATSSFVAMPAARVHNPELRSACRSARVGLISVDDDGVQDLVLAGRPARHSVHHDLLALTLLRRSAEEVVNALAI